MNFKALIPLLVVSIALTSCCKHRAAAVAPAPPGLPTASAAPSTAPTAPTQYISEHQAANDVANAPLPPPVIVKPKVKRYNPLRAFLAPMPVPSNLGSYEVAISEGIIVAYDPHFTPEQHIDFVLVANCPGVLCAHMEPVTWYTVRTKITVLGSTMGPVLADVRFQCGEFTAVFFENYQLEAPNDHSKDFDIESDEDVAKALKTFTQMQRTGGEGMVLPVKRGSILDPVYRRACATLTRK